MQKEQIFEKMNGFLAEGSHSLPEEPPLKMNLPREKSAAFYMKVCTRQAGICANGWEKTRIVMWRLS